jgi:hypothetical protein
MLDEVKDRVHAFGRCARSSRGLTFTDSDGTDRDEIYPNDDDGDNDDGNDDDGGDSTYNDDSDDDSGYTPPNDDGDASTDSSDFSVSSTPNQPLPAPIPIELGGVYDTRDRNDDPRNTGVEMETTGVDQNDEIENTDLEAYVNELKDELDNEIAELDIDYSQDSDEADDETDGTFEPKDEAEADELRADAAREQATDDAEMPEPDDEAPNQPLTELRRKRMPDYGHLKGRDGDGSLPTVVKPHEFGGGRHQSHVILQSVIMTQCNLKQGIRKFGDKGKEAVLTELQQLYHRDVMTPVNKYDLTLEERKGGLQYLMFLKEK